VRSRLALVMTWRNVRRDHVSTAGYADCDNLRVDLKWNDKIELIAVNVELLENVH